MGGLWLGGHWWCGWWQGLGGGRVSGVVGVCGGGVGLAGMVVGVGIGGVGDGEWWWLMATIDMRLNCCFIYLLNLLFQKKKEKEGKKLNLEKLHSIDFD